MSAETETKALRERLASARNRALILSLGIVAGLLIVLAGVLPAASRSVEKDPKDLQPPAATPDALLARSLNEKEAMYARFEAAQAAGAAAPAIRSVKISPNLPPLQNPDFQRGILTGEPGPFYSGEVFIENLWQDVIDGEFVQVYSGALGSDLDQGVVIVMTTGPDRMEGAEEWLLTPVKTGPLRIVSAKGGILLLQTDRGASWRLNLQEGTLSPARDP